MQVTIEEWNDMVKMYGDKLPNPEHYPESFKYVYKVYKLMKYDKAYDNWEMNIHYKE